MLKILCRKSPYKEFAVVENNKEMLLKRKNHGAKLMRSAKVF